MCRTGTVSAGSAPAERRRHDQVLVEQPGPGGQRVTPSGAVRFVTAEGSCAGSTTCPPPAPCSSSRLAARVQPAEPARAPRPCTAGHGPRPQDAHCTRPSLPGRRGSGRDHPVAPRAGCCSRAIRSAAREKTAVRAHLGGETTGLAGRRQQRPQGHVCGADHAVPPDRGSPTVGCPAPGSTPSPNARNTSGCQAVGGCPVDAAGDSISCFDQLIPCAFTWQTRSGRASERAR